MDAIGKADPRKTDKDVCISCMRCRDICPRHTRALDPSFMQAAERYKRNPAGISRDTKKLIEAAGFQAVDEEETRRLRNVSHLGFHAFRHSYVSMLINSGVNPLGGGGIWSVTPLLT